MQNTILFGKKLKGNEGIKKKKATVIQTGTKL